MRGVPAVRIGRPTFLKDTVVAALAGAALGALLLALLLAVGRRDWTGPVGDALQSLWIFYGVGLLLRLCLHGMHNYMNAGFAPEHESPRANVIKYSRPLLWLGAGGVTAGTVLLLVG